MELPFYEENWQDIPFKEVRGSHAYKDKVADASFYESFYKTLLDSKKEINPAWLAGKKAVSEWIEGTFLESMRKQLGDAFRILSIGAGMGVVEEPWAREGYHVELQECTEAPLKAFRASYPQVPVHICDGKAIPLPDGSYDLIVLSGVDYIFDCSNYVTLLKEINRLLKKEGIALCICFSNLPAYSVGRFFLIKLIKFVLGRSGSDGRVLWGWKRSIGNHVSHGEEAGMVAESIYIFEPKTFSPLETRKRSLFWTRPTLTDSHVAIAWRKK